MFLQYIRVEEGTKTEVIIENIKEVKKMEFKDKGPDGEADYTILVTFNDGTETYYDFTNDQQVYILNNQGKTIQKFSGRPPIPVSSYTNYKV